MKKLTIQESSEIQGAGCKKYLRRFHRAVRKEKGVPIVANIVLYYDCMGIPIT